MLKIMNNKWTITAKLNNNSKTKKASECPPDDRAIVPSLWKQKDLYYLFKQSNNVL